MKGCAFVQAANRNLNQRQRAILSLLTRNGSVRVSQLSQQLGVSEVTLRSDLKLMEQQGLLARTHGGAVPVQNGFLAYPWASAANSEGRSKLAAAAAALVHEGDTLLMNDGAFNCVLADMLVKNKEPQGLKLLTNSLSVALRLVGNLSLQTIFLGGILGARQNFTYGSDALEQLHHYHADKFFLAADGVDASGGITVHQAEDAPLLQLMIQRSRQVIILADNNMVGYESFFRIAPVTAAHLLVVSHNANANALDEIMALGVKVKKT